MDKDERVKDRKIKDSVSSELGLAFISARVSCLTKLPGFKKVSHVLLDLEAPSAFHKLLGPFYVFTQDKGTADAD